MRWRRLAHRLVGNSGFAGFVDSVIAVCADNFRTQDLVRIGDFTPAANPVEQQTVLMNSKTLRPTPR
jgi:hypothetical protein